ncbi:MAG: helix-turn-helix transcriptional regulator [Lachnospiraceae bacterium]|nr:helix-turn-helix transcriptional regulator [Lachnospiraceae bacterium]
MERRYPVLDVVKTGQNIKKIMQARGLTVRDIQTFLGLGTPQAIYHWFEGRNAPTLDNVYALSELFRLPIDAILCGNRKNIFLSSQTSGRRLYAYYVGILGMIA